MTARTFIPGLLCLALLGGCDRRDSEPLLGTLEWDRIGVPAEASETILDWKVAEGDSVQAGQLLLELDPRRLDARLDQARGQVAQAQARLDELSNGARQESIDAARATLVRNRADATEAGRNYQRVAALYARGQVAIAERDRARASRDQADAAVKNADAQLRELTNGNRPEQLAQADAELQTARAELARLQVDREHLDVRAPAPAGSTPCPSAPVTSHRPMPRWPACWWARRPMRGCSSRRRCARTSPSATACRWASRASTACSAGGCAASPARPASPPTTP